MLFLINDAVLQLDPSHVAEPTLAHRFRALSLAHVLKLGAELFALDPLLHRNNRPKVERLARLIVLKAPDVNAALFAAPAAGCTPEAVVSHLAPVPVQVMAQLHARHAAGRLDSVAADREVWRRLAA